MRTLIFMGAVALAALTISAPAAAEGPDSWNGSSFHDGRGDGGRHDGDRRDRRHQRHDGSGGIFVEYDSGAWAFYNNRSWQPDSYNDWWHDRPDRAFPRWVQHNQNCSPERMWWSGNGWHC
jgi:hypothetical protein